jgi:metal-responsive CopG/Arc/MetJ family transcriptional regulator
MPQTCFTLTEELLARIDRLAEKTERSRSGMIEALLEFAVPAWETGKISEAVKISPTVEEVKQMIAEAAEETVRKNFAILWAAAQKKEESK